jgi:hypothetical protein
VLCTCPMGKYIVNIRPLLAPSSLPDIEACSLERLGEQRRIKK